MKLFVNRVCEWMLKTSLLKSRRMAEPPLPSSLASDDVGTNGLVPRIVAGVETGRLGDDFVLLDGQGRTLRGLSPTAARVFELTDGARAAGEIASVLAGELEIPVERALEEVRRFLRVLSAWELVVYGAPAAAAPAVSPSP
jgi:pyrroloquinoline quinone biosynthesis protein D